MHVNVLLTQPDKGPHASLTKSVTFLSMVKASLVKAMVYLSIYNLQVKVYITIVIGMITGM